MGIARIRSLAASILVAVAAVACSSATGTTDGARPVVRLGYFANLTHASALVGVENGLFSEALGSAATLQTKIFNAGGDEITALFADALDIAYMGPSPTLNGWAKSKGEAIRVVSGATLGGAALIVGSSITKPEGLKGKSLASPQLGNTQDVALRAWLASKRLSTDLKGGGDVSVKPQENAQTLEAFQSGSIDGAWVPEPWASRLVLEGKGHVLVDEATLWPGGRYVTTQVVVRTAFLREHADLVEKFLAGHVAATTYLNDHADEGKAAAAAAIGKLTGKQLGSDVLDRAWSNLTFSNDPVASSLHKSAEQAQSLKLIEPVDLTGIYDLSLLNDVLKARGAPEIPV